MNGKLLVGVTLMTVNLHCKGKEIVVATNKCGQVVRVVWVVVVGLHREGKEIALTSDKCECGSYKQR